MFLIPSERVILSRGKHVILTEVPDPSIMPLTLELLRVLTQSRMEKRATSTLPSALQDDLPTCAQSCVATSIEQTFSSSNCSSSTGLGCLCSHYNTNGMTLGEVSLVCLNSNCQKSSLNETASSDAYYVCSAQTGAVTGTHTVLTSFATATAPSGTDQIVSSTTTPTSTSTPSSAAASASSSTSMSIPSTLVTGTTSSSISSSTIMPTITTSTIQTSTNISSTTTTSSSTVTAASEPTSNQSSTLTSSQAVGVSLGAVAGLAALIALIFCCCCVRRRKQKEDKEKKSRHSFDFVDKSPGPTSTFPSHLYMVPAAGGAQKIENAKRDSRAQAWTSFKTTINVGSSMQKPAPAPVDRHITQWPMPKAGAAASNRAEKWKPPRPPRPDSSATGLTIFDEDRTPRVPDFPVGITSPTQAYNPRMSRPKIRPAYADHYTLSPEDMHHPSLSLEIPPMPQGEIHEHRLPSPTHLTPHSPTMARPRSPDMTMPPTSAISYLPAYYTSNDSRTPILPLRSPRLSLPDPMPLIAPKEPLTPPRQLSTKNGHMSYASVTTFESVDPDEITPPDEVDKRLSAVAESPVSCVRYPKVPRPSNQAIPRSPPQSRWTASTAAFSPSSPEGKKPQSGAYIAFSPSALEGHKMHPGAYRAFSFDETEEKPLTLLTKRRGEGVQADLEQRLHINNPSARSRRSSNYSQPSAQKTGLTIGDMGSPFRGKRHLEIMEMGLKSPLWEPELTPSKRGDDLFISVH